MVIKLVHFLDRAKLPGLGMFIFFSFLGVNFYFEEGIVSVLQTQKKTNLSLVELILSC